MFSCHFRGTPLKPDLPKNNLLSNCELLFDEDVTMMNGNQLCGEGYSSEQKTDFGCSRHDGPNPRRVQSDLPQKINSANCLQEQQDTTSFQTMKEVGISHYQIVTPYLYQLIMVGMGRTFLQIAAKYWLQSTTEVYHCCKTVNLLKDMAGKKSDHLQTTVEKLTLDALEMR